MRIGLQIPIFTWPGGAAALAGKLREIADRRRGRRLRRASG